MWEIVEDTYVCDPGLTTLDPWDFGGRRSGNMVIRESTSRFVSNSGDEGDAFPIAAVVLRVDLWVMASRDLDVGHRPVLVGNEGESQDWGGMRKVDSTWDGAGNEHLAVGISGSVGT